MILYTFVATPLPTGQTLIPQTAVIGYTGDFRDDRGVYRLCHRDCCSDVHACSVNVVRFDHYESGNLYGIRYQFDLAGESIPSWGTQRSPLNTYPPQAVTPPKAPNQAPIGQWSSPTWGTQVLPFIENNPFSRPWFPQPLNYEVVNSWPQPNWGTQTLPTGFPPAPVTPWVPLALNAEVISSWPQVTWGTQTLPVTIPLVPLVPWNPAMLDYDLLASWPQVIWGAQTYPPVLGLFGPPLFIPGAIEPWPVHWPNPPVSQAQLRKYIESQRRAATRRARQIAAQVQEEQELRETIVRAIYGEPEQAIQEIEKAKAPELLKRMDRGQVKALIQAFAKPYSSRPITEAEAHEIAAKIT